jgi:hypothetical protein
MKHVRSLTKPLPQEALVLDNLLGLLLSLLLSPITWLIGLFGKGVL